MTRVSLRTLVVCASLGLSAAAFDSPVFAQTQIASADPSASVDLLASPDSGIAGVSERRPRKSIFRRGLRALFGNPANSPYVPPQTEAETGLPDAPQEAASLPDAAMTPDFDPGTVSIEDPVPVEPALPETPADDQPAETPPPPDVPAETAAPSEVPVPNVVATPRPAGTRTVRLPRPRPTIPAETVEVVPEASETPAPPAAVTASIQAPSTARFLTGEVAPAKPVVRLAAAERPPATDVPVPEVVVTVVAPTPSGSLSPYRSPAPSPTMASAQTPASEPEKATPAAVESAPVPESEPPSTPAAEAPAVAAAEVPAEPPRDAAVPSESAVTGSEEPLPAVDPPAAIDPAAAPEPEQPSAAEQAPDGAEDESGEGVSPAFVPLPARLAIDTTPRDLVKKLQNLQDQIAQGSTEAFAAQRTLLERIDRTLSGMPAEAWQDRLNATALVTYVLSGGKPNVLRRLLEASPFPALDERLMRGALAYVEGDLAKAKELLSDFDARSFPASMGSQLAIAQAAVAFADDPKRAAALLAIARLLSPGTLAEEAALRREILVASQLQETDKFEQLSRQYVQRFRHSVYAGNFRQRFAGALTRMRFIDDPAELPRLDGMLSELEPKARQELYLTVARAAVVQAKTEAARFAAGRVLEMAEPGSADRARALLYRAAASVVVADGFDAAREDLKAIDQLLLDPSDTQLFAVVAGTAEAIATASEPRPVPADEPPAAEAPAEDAAAVADANAGESPAITQAREAIEIADNLLGAQTQ